MKCGNKQCESWTDSEPSHCKVLLSAAANFCSRFEPTDQEKPVADNPCRCHACQIATETNEVSEHDTAIFAVAEYIKAYGLGKCVSNASAAALAAEIIEAFTFQQPNKETKPEGPLPAALIADKADTIADTLGDLAMELDIADGLKWASTITELRAMIPTFTRLAQTIREG